MARKRLSEGTSENIREEEEEEEVSGDATASQVHSRIFCTGSGDRFASAAAAAVVCNPSTSGQSI